MAVPTNGEDRNCNVVFWRGAAPTGRAGRGGCVCWLVEFEAGWRGGEGRGFGLVSFDEEGRGWWFGDEGGVLERY